MLPCTPCCRGWPDQALLMRELHVANVARGDHSRRLRPAISYSLGYPQLPACLHPSFYSSASCYRPAATSPQAQGCLSPLPAARCCACGFNLFPPLRYRAFVDTEFHPPLRIGGASAALL